MRITAAELKSRFPDMDGGLVEGVHEACDGVYEEAADQLRALGGVEVKVASAAKPSAAAAAPGAASTAAGGSSSSNNVVLRHDSDGMHSSDTDGMDSRAASQFAVDFESAVASGAELRKLQRETAVGELMYKRQQDIIAIAAMDRKFDQFVAAQRKMGPQSLRKYTPTNTGSGHVKACYDQMVARERQHCGEFVCFYHSYSFAALIYEVQACISRMVYALPDDLAPMPRIRKKPFIGKPHVKSLIRSFSSMQGQDHDTRFREVAISVSMSLGSPSSEAPPMQCFAMGYSCTDLSFRGVLLQALAVTGASTVEANAIADKASALAAKCHLSGNYGQDGMGMSHSTSQPGHMLQIFVRTDCVDDVAYGSHAYGVYRPDANPLSEYLCKPNAPDGQARVFWHPTLFLNPKTTRVYHYAADPKAAEDRSRLQEGLQRMLEPVLDTPEKMIRALKLIEGVEAE